MCELWTTRIPVDNSPWLSSSSLTSSDSAHRGPLTRESAALWTADSRGGASRSQEAEAVVFDPEELEEPPESLAPEPDEPESDELDPEESEEPEPAEPESLPDESLDPFPLVTEPERLSVR